MKMKCARRRHQKKAAIPKGLSPIGTQCEPMGLNAVYEEKDWAKAADTIVR